MEYFRARLIGSLLSIVAAMTLIGCDAPNDVPASNNASESENIAETDTE